MFGHAVRFGIQQIAWVAQQVQDSGVSSADLLLLQVLFFVGKEGISVYGWQQHGRGNPLPPALLGVVSFSMPVAAKMHGELEHASHEDCAVTHAGPIHCLSVNIVQVGAHDNILECPVHCQHHIQMSIEGI